MILDLRRAARSSIPIGFPFVESTNIIFKYIN
jgi:hypothetical protein